MVLVSYQHHVSLGFAIIMVILSGIISASEIGVLLCQHLHKATAKEQEIISNPTKFLIMLNILNLSCNIGIQNILSYILSDYSFAYTVILTTGVCIICCDLVPKTIGMYLTNYSFWLAVVCFGPIVPTFSYIYTYISIIAAYLLYPIESILSLGKSNVDVDEVKHILNKCKTHKLISQYQNNIFLNQYSLTASTCGDIHIPVHEIQYVRSDSDSTNLISIMEHNAHRVVPICNKDIQNPVAIANVYDIIGLMPGTPISQVIHVFPSPCFIHEHVPVYKLFNLFNKIDTIAVFSIDELGQLTGMITRQIIWQFMYLSPIKEVSTDIEWLSASSMIVPGNILLSDLADIIDIEFISHTNMKTLGGWIIEQCDTIPQVGEKLVTKLMTIKIIERNQTVIKKVYLKILE